MKLIGLTGGAGTGKTTVADMFRELGATVVDADEATHAVYASGTPGFDAVVREFGPEYVRGGEINRARLGQLVFKDRGARERLNAIVHPLVRQWMADRTADAFDRGAQVVIEDVPLLYENGLQGLFESVVLVYATPATQVARLVEGRGLSLDRASSMLASQMPIDEKREKANFVIDNDGTREETRRQAREIWPRLSK